MEWNPRAVVHIDPDTVSGKVQHEVLAIADVVIEVAGRHGGGFRAVQEVPAAVVESDPRTESRERHDQIVQRIAIESGDLKLAHVGPMQLNPRRVVQEQPDAVTRKVEHQVAGGPDVKASGSDSRGVDRMQLRPRAGVRSYPNPIAG